MTHRDHELELLAVILALAGIIALAVQFIAGYFDLSAGQAVKIFFAHTIMGAMLLTRLLA